MLIKHINRLNDEEIINLIIEIMGNETLIVETFNESILVELLKQRGTPIRIKGGRDTKKDFKLWLEEENPNGRIKQFNNR